MDSSTDKTQSSLLDRVAIGLSALCLLHCIALPAFLLAVPLLERFATDHYHVQVLVFVLPVSIVALSTGYLRHRQFPIVAFGATGLALLVLGATWAHTEIGLLADRVLTVVASLILAGAHFANTRLGRRQRFGNCMREEAA